MAENVPNVFDIDSVDLDLALGDLDLDLGPLSSDPFKVSTVFISWKLKIKVIQIQKFNIFFINQNTIKFELQ